MSELKVNESSIPVYILSGFLGSGKTTLLVQLIEHWQQQGLRPAVVMNELGEVNLDGQMVDSSVPMTEMLGGCICCTVRGDLGLQLADLVQEESPDIIIIEATGAANPMEILDAVTETSLYMRLELKSLITVVDAAHLSGLYQEQKGQTFKLMQEQIRCASVLLLNKTDRVNEQQLADLRDLLTRWNGFAPVIPTVRCEVDMDVLLRSGDNVHAYQSVDETSKDAKKEQHVHSEACAEHGCSHEHEHEHPKHMDHNHEAHQHSDVNVHGHSQDHDHSHAHPHASHEHVMVYTHYFTQPVNSEAFERLIAELPRDVYRAKGILSFSDTSSRFWFQYAYRESDYMKITPQGDVPNVAVFIGEHFDQTVIRNQLLELEAINES
ncbi:MULTISPECIES: CobW family GTP-binding protein [unclassified Paenibacillus]|uniref:CobW family GTP-binding protein n=1 Tax=unclassified Paenibacillus TaxID=185978 RepID=UPI0004659458|nr:MULTISPECIES: GTP-binding protein [unclassified Paenibacillus]KGP81011.1 cobalamin biosynthesis protein [Paenibacillus sp. MAEPY1]KGP82941.1 cobalamin biosynthesis protein [Paenibacillus sp. MAEPY2]